ncbi:DUF1684 domain-containing protein [Stigmatella sp. ncwal1]|uniref:DUF1684 domain-containing protein n=1 Tax=Stigmatella ashevillensis TaxID=2995309 RepID=A0ABT5DHU0_9BACT|nr:DUF1684 domain-containing protein [Stigmatella ashevillena]MDC0713091.1 DUF1684 domain-containing protein [Stigmatella ashevillena]
MRRDSLLALLLLGLPASALAAPPSPAKTMSAKPSSVPADLETETRAWHAERIARLSSEDGWLSLVGLHWLEEGDTRVGSAADNALVLPAPAPAHVGVLTRKADTVSLTLQPGVSLTVEGKPFKGGALRTDASGSPDTVALGTLRFFVIRRGDRLGVRVKDSEAATRKGFHGIPTYAPSATWRVEGRFEPATSEKKIAVPNVLGEVEDMVSPGTVLFSVGGQEYRLSPVAEPGSNQFFFIFGDLTNRDETYGAGRFLYTDLPKDGKVVMDFNRAYNPPCAFTPFATCPLPPSQNKLKLRVEAGEKRYGDH